MPDAIVAPAFLTGDTMDMNTLSFDHDTGARGGPLTRAPAVRLKPARRRRVRICGRPGARTCICGRAFAPPLRADKRWRLGGAPCLILRREAVPC